MAGGMFETLNSTGESLNYLVGDSPEDLLEQIKQIRSSVHIVSIYAIGSKHYAWIQTSVKIIKKKKEK